ncbi:FCS-Like Zinc finger 8 [Ricinus communis]|uniref:FLZ-type domain-containing protein n=1 Tax=Ricinus communis TaxID=3988 RepID=B9SFJ4_RICCO|nr:FCS-Like Zinc finger 8 [Ricinus communis]EEF37606.1 conserved hypothetical protein [Ricinus communis]|eukprot:XP_002524763.1 protein MARD1 [Ricinus communis]
MLRNRSRAVTSKQALMTDHSSHSPSTQNHTKPIPSFFGSPRFKGFTFKRSPEAEPVISPTSILEPFSSFKNPFCHDTNQPKSPRVSSENKYSWDKLDSKGIAVALIDEEKPNEQNNSKKISKPSNKMVLYGTKLRVQIPPPANFMFSAADSPISPGDFGIKTRNAQLSGSGSGIQTKESPGVFTGCVPMSELELSEDYTCVISYGPNPKTTHKFGNCVLENYCSLSDKSNSAPNNFLSFCHKCKKNLEQKIDIFIYRGEKAFCSQECRYQEMMLDGIES